MVRHHDTGSTPYRRMLGSRAMSASQEVVLEKLYLSLNPLQLSRQVDNETEKLLRQAWRQGDSLTWAPSW